MKKLAALLSAFALAMPAASLAAVLNDEVTSAKLKEADNTASQDTNSGSGVKTGHLQNKAVTGAKIADGTITATQLANGAVTDAKITGPISAAKLGAHSHTTSQVSGLDAALASKADLSTVYQRFTTVVVVSPDGRGDFTDPVAALAAITDASAAKPYLVKILPGVYSATGTIAMKPFVDVEGSGRNVTAIVGSGMAYGVNLVELSPNAEIRALSLKTDSAYFTVHGSGLARDVSVSLTGPAQGGSKIAAYLLGPAKLQDVEIVVRPDAPSGGGGVYVASGSVELVQVRVDVASIDGAGAVAIDAGAAATITDSTLIAVGGSIASTLDGAGEARVRTSQIVAVASAGTAWASRVYGLDVAHSEITATGPNAVAIIAGRSVNNLSARVAYSQVSGQLLKQPFAGTSFNCLGVFDANWVPVSCP